MKTIFSILFTLSFLFNYGQAINKKTSAKIDSILQIVNSQKGNELLKSYEELSKLYIGNKPEVAIKYIDSLFNASISSDNLKYSTKAEIMRAFYLMEKAELKKAEDLYIKHIPVLDSLNLGADVASAYSMLGVTQMQIGNFDSALDSQLKALRKAQSLEYSDNKLSGFYLNLAGVYMHVGNNDLAIDYLEQAETTYVNSKNQPGLMRVKANIAMLQLRKKDYQKAIDKYKESAAYFKEVNDTHSLARMYNFIGQAYKRALDFNNAKIWYNNALKITKENNWPKISALAYRDLGRVAGLEKNDKQALYYYQKSLEVNKKAKSKRGVLDDYSLISKYYVRNNDYKSAYENQRQFGIVKDSIFGKENMDKINELHLQFETEKKEAALALQEEEIKTLNVQAENDRLTKTLYGIGMFSFLAIAGLLYFGFKQRIKKNKIEQEKQEEIYKQEIAFKKKELASQTLHLVQKSTFIQELKENLEKIKKSPELFKVEFRRLVMLLKKESAEDKDWEVFKSYFSEVHNNFDHKIKSIAGDISEKEMRLASFLKMNLTTKEIASMLNVLPDSVLKSKYRLKKKLGLNKETDLTEYLSSL
ncbi:tetratricopeptide repeat protein [Ichthyenterobacterium sp. W332]|uniref:Tetratricopeptide repeat protein n=1 Tax=Microcosmobacter mediterraneus TaxID=3075607 RepID=A0ABU2YL94_9FLAO|nr:tetratricopeptide repeat protein [Ichthyenterobacterium sp. W332]MDT0558822.1 tetratricopeptide repeat protein [Ichthyenterobacterium sp. W332]